MYCFVFGVPKQICTDITIVKAVINTKHTSSSIHDLLDLNPSATTCLVCAGMLYHCVQLFILYLGTCHLSIHRCQSHYFTLGCQADPQLLFLHSLL